MLFRSNWYRAGGCQRSYNHPYPMPICLPVRHGLIIWCYGESNPIGHEVQKVRSDVIEELGDLILMFWLLVCWITTSRATKPSAIFGPHTFSTPSLHSPPEDFMICVPLDANMSAWLLEVSNTLRLHFMVPLLK